MITKKLLLLSILFLTYIQPPHFLLDLVEKALHQKLTMKKQLNL